MPNFRDIIIYTLINLSEQLATQVALGSSLFLLFLIDNRSNDCKGNLAYFIYLTRADQE